MRPIDFDDSGPPDKGRPALLHREGAGPAVSRTARNELDSQKISRQAAPRSTDFHHDEPELYEIVGVRCVFETPKALLVEVKGERHWVPRRLVDAESDITGKGDHGSLVVHITWALRRGLATQDAADKRGRVFAAWWRLASLWDELAALDDPRDELPVLILALEMVAQAFEPRDFSEEDGAHFDLQGFAMSRLLRALLTVLRRLQLERALAGGTP